VVHKRSLQLGFVFVLVLGLQSVGLAGLAGPVDASHDDGTHVTGGATFETATPVTPLGLYHSNLPFGSDHYYRFHAEMGEPINIEIRPFCNTQNCPVLTAGSIGTGEAFLRMSFRLLSPDGVLLDTPNSNVADSRVMVAAAPVTGEYRFQVTSNIGGFSGPYSFCFLVPPPAEHPCPDYGIHPMGVIFGGPMAGAFDTKVLLVPPPHGDLGNPNGPTVLDYLDAAISGIREWEWALSEFAKDYPEYSYLDDISVHIEIFDGLQDFSNYDIVITYVPGGPLFRGAATTCTNPPRCIVLSLFSSSPRAGQVEPGFPTYNDLEAVTKHEFAHVWGLGHTLTWTEEFGPDLMNSPASFVYGDGSAVGEGPVDSPKQCISSLNLYGMARIFASDFVFDPINPEFSLPGHIPYEWYCP
jgi:hypothetical protein